MNDQIRKHAYNMIKFVRYVHIDVHINETSRCMRKHTFRDSDQVQHKPACTVPEQARSLKFHIYEEDVLVAKTKALTCCAVTAQLICVILFGYAKCLFSHDRALIEYEWALIVLSLIHCVL